jgi:hypothetical protein
MLPKQVFFLTADQLCAYQWRRGRLWAGEQFSADAAGLDAFSTYLERFPGTPAYLIADMVEEDFHRQLLPHVGGSARRKMVARRLRQMYRDTPFRHALVQGRDTEGRRDDMMMFSALTNPDLVLPWLERIESARTPLAAVYSATFLAARMVRRLALAREHLVLITHQAGGLRQTYFQGRHLKFSRLSPTGDLPYADMVAAETERMEQFLASTRLVARGHRLQVVVLTPTDQLSALEQTCTDSATVAFRFISMDTAAARLGLASVPARADPLLMAVVGHNAPATHYPPGPAHRFYRLWQARIGLFAASATVLASGLAWTGANLWAMQQDEKQLAALQAEVPVLEQRYRTLAATLPAAAAPSDRMRAAVLFEQLLRRQSPAPATMVSAISAALERAPSVRLNALSWRAVPASAGTAGETARPILPASLGLPRSPAQTVDIEGEIEAAATDYRTMLAAVQGFTQDLARHPNTVVKLIQAPVDVRSNVRITGKAGGPAGDGRPAFVIRMVWTP